MRPPDAHRAPVTEPATTCAPAGSAPVTRSACTTRRSNPLSALEKKLTAKATRQAKRSTSSLFPCAVRSPSPERQFRIFGPDSALSYQSPRRHFPQSASALPPAFPKRNAYPIFREQTANKGAAENCSGRRFVSRWLLPPPPFRHRAASAPLTAALRSL